MAEQKETKVTTLEDRRKALEERRKAREAKRSSKEADKAKKRAEIDQMIEEQMEDVEDIRDRLEEAGENSDLLIWKTDHGVVACQPPKPHVMARFRKEINKTGKKQNLMQATDVLVLDCLKYPSRAEFEQILKALPLLPESISTELLDSAGGGREAESVKKS
jgi:hypothetical protein